MFSATFFLYILFFKSNYISISDTGSDNIPIEKVGLLNNEIAIKVNTTTSIPLKVDWREKDVISHIHNQGKCGACWAHSVLETIESLETIKNKSKGIIELSVQQMIDCAKYNNYGCHGGNTCALLQWLVDENVQIATTSEYPSSVDGLSHNCTMNDDGIKSNVRIHNFTCESFANKEIDLLKILANHGPVTAAVNAATWKNYLGGIIQRSCTEKMGSLNHAVQIIGYDLRGIIPFYLIKNSWGASFGKDGYMRIKVGENICGIVNQVSVIYV